ncbi:MAG: hypothetical protein JSR99_01315 [Proteobacteria bacterium]|nr:hypothetical protein [Pseudomonadota bacterium]
MLISLETTAEGEKRVYCTRGNSVVTYFADDGEGGSMLSVEPGEFASPYSTTEEKLQAVKESVLREVARRLSCEPAEVQAKPMADLTRICDPHLAFRDHWVGRGRRPFVR